MNQDHDIRTVPSFCYNCVAGPCLMKVKVRDGVASEIMPNFDAEGIHPANGRCCVKAYGVVQKTYNPGRVLTPMKRSNPKKGRDEDPGFVPISWDEALDTICDRLAACREKGLLDEAGLPRVAATFGMGGTPVSYMGTFPAFLSAWGPVDFSFGSGQGVKCVHAEHLYGEYWHRAFIVCADTPHTKYIVSFGANVEATGGTCAVTRHADARVRGVKRVNIEPHMSITAAASSEWVPIKPKTDNAFMFAMLHSMLHEHPRASLDLPYLRDRTASPYLVGPRGLYLRDAQSKKPLVWDLKTKHAVPFDTPDTELALEGSFRVPHAIDVGADDDVATYADVDAETVLTKMITHLAPYTPEWATEICDVPAETIRRIVREYLEHASIGETIEIDGRVLPYRPVAVTLGKNVNNGWGSYDCVWARTVLAMLVGALEVPGGTIGTTTRLNRPQSDRLKSVTPGVDGFMSTALNATDKENWEANPTGRNAHKTLVPIVGNSGWSQALGPTHLAWMFTRNPPDNWPAPTYPDVWFLYRSNPSISFFDTDELAESVAQMPFIVAFAYTPDESNHMADILLPDATDLESMQLIRMGGTKFVEQLWQHQGVVLRQPAVEPCGEARDFTWIATELARRTGLLEGYNSAINRGAGGMALQGKDYDFSLATDTAYEVNEIWDRSCKAATAKYSKGEEVHGLEWFEENGFFVVPFKQVDWYLHPTMVDQGLRYELPYQERLFRVGQELKNRLHEKDIHWWDEQLTEYAALPHWCDVHNTWDRAVENMGADPLEFPLWLISTKSMQYASGNNVSIQLMDEVSQNVRGHGRILINTKTAATFGLNQDDWVELRSPIAKTRGRVAISEGIRPDTLVVPGQFGHWATPFAKDLNYPSLNKLAPMSLDLTDSTGSGADMVRVSVTRLVSVDEDAAA
jgi:phenylacetyl-CoA:acceptor oxidoreductase